MIGEYCRTTRDIQRETDEILAELGRCNFGVSYLDDALLGMAPGDLTLVGARTGGGKTEFSIQVLLAQQLKDRVKSVLYLALDHDDGEIEKRVMWRLIVSQIKKIPEHPLHGKYLRYAEWVSGKYSGLIKDIEGDSEIYLKHLFALSETTFIYRKGVLTADDISEIILDESSKNYGLFILDHFHSIKKIDGLEKQGDAISILSKAAEISCKPILILGQFRKRAPSNKAPIPDMEEFSGSSQLLYLPQNIIVLAPRFLEDTEKWETYFHVVKSRTASDTKTFVGVHSFDMEKKEYSDKYQLMRHVPYSEPTEIESSKIPRWAKRGFLIQTKEKKSKPFTVNENTLPYKEN